MPHPDSPQPPSLADLRGAIDATDLGILRLLSQRAHLAADIGRLKRESRAPFHVPHREREVLNRLEEANPGPLANTAVRAIFREVMSACLGLEQPLRVAFLGPEGTFTHQAVQSQFGLGIQAVPCGRVASVFQAVERGQADYGVVPIENATEGAVDSSLDAFFESSLTISAEIILPVSHALLARTPVDLGTLQRVHSHPQALAQCRRWLEENLPGASLQEAPSTAEAARRAWADPGGAAIASALTARLFDLMVLRQDLQDLRGNATRFLVLGGEEPKPTGLDRTTLLLTVRDAPGALLGLLEPLAHHGLNMTRIESRPTRRVAWEHAFFVDVEGHREDPAMIRALQDLRTHTQSLRILGSYPRAARPTEQGACA